ncbi:MAG: S66 peptidase family protein [Leptospirillum sp.]|nr:LD-carboxypeptidase [Nitrospiraceae bacterium]
MTGRNIPRRLSPGMSVAVLSPCLMGDPNGHPKALENLRAVGLDVTFQDIREDGYAPFVASDKTRAQSFQHALESGNVDAILFARGGYGAARILPWLEKNAPPPNFPLVLGLSDITNIHSWLFNAYRAVSFHGPHLRGLSDTRTFELFWEMVSGKIGSGSDLPIGESSVVQRGESEGILLGGNLETLAHLCGSAWLPKRRPEEDWILLLEDIDEPMYAIDRAIRSLMHAGYLSGIRGVILGPFMGRSPRPDDPKGSLEELVREAIPDVPIVTSSLSGHGTPMATWPLGVRVRLSAGHSSAITLLEDPFKGNS